jgi:hypothetical protein
MCIISLLYAYHVFACVSGYSTNLSRYYYVYQMMSLSIRLLFFVSGIRPSPIAKFWISCYTTSDTTKGRGPQQTVRPDSVPVTPSTLTSFLKKWNNSFIYLFIFFFLGGGSATPSVSPPQPSFSNYSFLVHHLVNRDDRYLLARGKVYDFLVLWQFSCPERLVFHYRSNSTPMYSTPALSLFFLFSGA